jgi:hypothetical protein
MKKAKKKTDTSKLNGHAAMPKRKKTVKVAPKEAVWSMSQATRNSGKEWTSQELKQLEKLADQNTPTKVIGLKLGRTENAVRSKASEEGVSLKPTIQSPYKPVRKKKELTPEEALLKAWHLIYDSYHKSNRVD